MGSYLQPRPEKKIITDIEDIKPPENDLNSLILRIIKIVYGDNIIGPKEIEGHTFIAAQGNLVFDLIGNPSLINPQKLKAALTNHYSTEVIYLVPDRVLTNHPQIGYRNIADYVRILQSKNQSDLVRWINEFRNKAETDYARIKKTKSFQTTK